MRTVNKSTNRCIFIAHFHRFGWKLLIRLPGGTWYESDRLLTDAERCSSAWRSRRVLLGRGKIETYEDSSGVLITSYDNSQTYVEMTRYSPTHVALLTSHV